MKSGWAIKKLGEVCRPSNGLWKGKKGPFKNIAVLRSTNFTKDCLLNLDDVVYIDVESRLLPQKLLKEGDIIVEKSGGGPRQPVGRPVYFDKRCGEYSFCNFTSMLRVLDESVLPIYLHRCLYYLYVSGATEPLQSYTIGLRNLDFKGYLDLQIPVPSLPEQKRIVAKIDAAFEKIDKLKANAERNLANAKELFQSALDEAMRPKKGWVEKRLGDNYEITSSKRVFKEEWKTQGVPFYRAREIVKLARDGFVKNELFISAEMYAEYGKKYGLPKAGDIMITGVGTLGVTYVVREDDRFYFKDGNIIWLKKNNETLSSEFVALSYLTEDVKKQVYANQGATVGTYTIEMAKATNIYAPSLAEQKRVVEQMAAARRSADLLALNYARQIADCAEMRQSVLREAFEGRL